MTTHRSQQERTRYEPTLGDVMNALQDVRDDIAGLASTLADLVGQSGPALFCPPDERTHCPGGFALQHSRVEAGQRDPAKLRDSFFHPLPEALWFDEPNSTGGTNRVKNHNVYRSRALTYEQADALLLFANAGLVTEPRRSAPTSANGHVMRDSAPRVDARTPSGPIPHADDPSIPSLAIPGSDPPRAISNAGQFLAWCSRWYGASRSEVLTELDVDTLDGLDIPRAAEFLADAWGERRKP